MSTLTLPRIATRMTGSLLGATLTTLGLLALMNLLISVNVEPPVEFTPKPVEVVMEEPVIETFKDDKPKKADDPQTPPQDFPDLIVEPVVDTNITPQFAAVKREKIDIGHGGIAATDGEYLPIVKVEPNYPRSALRKGIEGWVLVEFTVTSSGAVRDAHVVDAQPARVFDRAATRAALKFKYKPRVIDGVAVEVPGVRNKISFAIAGE